MHALASAIGFAATFLVSRLPAQAVKEEQLGGVPIAVVVPENGSPLTEEQRVQLGNVLLQAATANGISGIGGPAGFQLIPLVTITRETEAGELRKFTVVFMNVALAIRQSPQNTAYASTSVALNGSGASRDAAITDAIMKLSPDDQRILTLVETGKRRIVEYYQTNCESIRSDARGRAGTGRADEAIALLMTVPRQASSCQQLAAADAERLYVAKHERECQALVRDARADVARNDFKPATSKLRLVDPASGCAKSADALIAEIDAKVAKANDREFSLELRALRAERDSVTKAISLPNGLTKHRQNATKLVAVEFVAKSLPVRKHSMGPS